MYHLTKIAFQEAKKITLKIKDATACGLTSWHDLRYEIAS